MKKCVRNKDGTIKRIDEDQAANFVKMGWEYCSKQAWKEQVRDVDKPKPTEEKGTPIDKANLKVKKSGKNKGGVK